MVVVPLNTVLNIEGFEVISGELLWSVTMGEPECPEVNRFNKWEMNAIEKRLRNAGLLQIQVKEGQELLVVGKGRNSLATLPNLQYAWSSEEAPSEVGTLARHYLRKLIPNQHHKELKL